MCHIPHVRRTKYKKKGHGGEGGDLFNTGPLGSGSGEAALVSDS